MKKKILIITIIMALLISLAAMFVGCDKGNDNDNIDTGNANILYDPSAEGMELVADLDSHDLMMQAYETYKNSQSYAMEIDFVFNATAAMATIDMDLYQSTYQKTIRNNGDFYDYYIIAGKGMSVPTGIGREFKYTAKDGKSKARYINKDNKKVKLVKNKVTADFSGVAWGNFNAKNEDDISSVKEKINKTKQNFHQYNWLDEKYLASSTDKKVYKKDDKYYCTIIINTIGSAVKETQPEVVKAIEKATGGKFAKFNKNTSMMAEIEKVDGKYRFTQFVLTEDYAGVKQSLGEVTINASQCYKHKFSYDANSVVIPA